MANVQYPGDGCGGSWHPSDFSHYLERQAAWQRRFARLEHNEVVLNGAEHAGGHFCCLGSSLSRACAARSDSFGRSWSWTRCAVKHQGESYLICRVSRVCPGRYNDALPRAVDAFYVLDTSDQGTREVHRKFLVHFSVREEVRYRVCDPKFEISRRRTTTLCLPCAPPLASPGTDHRPAGPRSRLPRPRALPHGSTRTTCTDTPHSSRSAPPTSTHYLGQDYPLLRLDPTDWDAPLSAL